MVDVRTSGYEITLEQALDLIRVLTERVAALEELVSERVSAVEEDLEAVVSTVTGAAAVLRSLND